MLILVLMQTLVLILVLVLLSILVLMSDLLIDDNPIPQHPTCPLFKFEAVSGNSVAAEDGGPETY